MAAIHCLTLDIFYYYLKEGFGITKADIEHFDAYWDGWQHEYKSKEYSIKFQHENLQGNLVHRTNQLEDSNYFFLDCSLLDTQDISESTDQPDLIKPLKSKLRLPLENKISLGYTQIIYGWVDAEDNLLSAQLYEQLIGDSWQHCRSGKILGSTVIEAWRSRQEWDIPEVGSHVFIVLYPNQDTYDKANKLIFDGWLPLLLYRHKICYSYQKSRLNKEKARRTFNQAIQDLQEYNTYTLIELGNALQRNLRILTNYSTDLHTISTHQNAINTNLHNYKYTIEQFERKANDDCKINKFWVNDLEFLKEFSTIAEVKYEKQLEKDYAILAPGLAVLTGLTETIRGLVEVQQAEIDRQQTNTIAIAGLGLATSSAVAGIVATQVYQPEQPKIDPSPKPQATPTTAEPASQTTTQPNTPPPDWLLGRDRLSIGWGFLYIVVITAVVMSFLIAAIRSYQNYQKRSK